MIPLAHYNAGFTRYFESFKLNHFRLSVACTLPAMHIDSSINEKEAKTG